MTNLFGGVEVVVPEAKQKAYRALQKLWDKAVDTPGYDKRAWQQLETLIAAVWDDGVTAGQRRG